MNTHEHILTLTLTLSLSHTLTHTLTHSPKHTHTQTHTNAQIFDKNVSSIKSSSILALISIKLGSHVTLQNSTFSTKKILLWERERRGEREREKERMERRRKMTFHV